MNEPLSTIGRYRIQRELGRGMMGVVFLAHDPDLGRDIALKVIQLPPGADGADRASFEPRFFAEARSAARLSHPNIVTVHDVGRDPSTGALYMALQLLPGRTLDSILRERARLDSREALRIAYQIAIALHHAHGERVVHRDVKPANIMILPTGEAVLMDFGIAQLETSRLTATGQFVGTPLYMSPEQAMAKPVDGRSDIFSLGSVLYEMLTGTAAFAGENFTRILFLLISSEPEPPSRLVSSLSPAIDNVLRRCLAKDVSSRYKDAHTLADDLALLTDVTGGNGAIKPTISAQNGTVAAGTAAAVGPGGSRARSAPIYNVPDQDVQAGRGKKRPKRAAALVAAFVILAGTSAWLIVGQRQVPVARRIVENPAQPGAGATSVPPSSSPANETSSAATTSAATRDPNLPAQLLVDFEHSLKGGVFRIYIDDERVIDQPFGGRITKKIAGLEIRKGRLTETIEVTPGTRSVVVEVLWEGNSKKERTQTVFNPGGRLRLKAKLGSLGGLRKDLSLEWN